MSGSSLMVFVFNDFFISLTPYIMIANYCGWHATVWPVNLLNPKSHQHLISPYSNVAELFIKILRKKEVIAKLRSFDCYTNSPCQYQKKGIQKRMENVDADVRV